MKRLLVLWILLLPLAWFAVGCTGGSSASSDKVPPKDQQEAMKKAQMEMMKKDTGQQPKK